MKLRSMSEIGMFRQLSDPPFVYRLTSDVIGVTDNLVGPKLFF